MSAQADRESVARRDDHTAHVLCILQAADRIDLAMRALDRRGLLDDDWRDQLRYDLAQIRRAGMMLRGLAE